MNEMTHARTHAPKRDNICDLRVDIVVIGPLVVGRVCRGYLGVDWIRYRSRRRRGLSMFCFEVIHNLNEWSIYASINI